MSAEAEIFRTTHRLFKKLKRLKTQVKAKVKNSDVFNVFRSYLDDLLVVVSNEFERCVQYDRESTGKRLRLEAMEIALIYEKTNALIFINKKDKIPNSQSIASLKSCLQRFEADQLTDELFLVYFRALNYLSLAQIKRFSNTSLAQHYLTRAQQMYDSLEQPGNRRFYDIKQLFAETVDIQPIERGYELIDNLFMDYLQQFEEIYRSKHDKENLTKVMQLTLKISSANTSPIVLMERIVEIAHLLLGESKNITAAYYLFVALKMLEDCSVYDQKSTSFARIRPALASAWMNYTFEVLIASTDFIKKKYSGEDLERLNKFLIPFKSNKEILQSQSHHDKIGDGDPTDSFDIANKFHMVQLTPSEMPFCLHSIQQLSEAQQLLNYSIDIIDGLIASTDASKTPMDYLVYHYQLSDLLLIRSIFEENFVPTYSFLKLRFERCNEMIQTMSEDCPKIFEIVGGSILNDLSEILLDLYLYNVSRSTIATDDVQILKKKLLKLGANNVSKN